MNSASDFLNNLRRQVERPKEAPTIQRGSWSVNFGGFSVDPANPVVRYIRAGKACWISVAMPTNGTSNATTFTVNLPFTAATITNMQWRAAAVTIDNGTLSANPGQAVITSGATVVTLYRTFAGAGWTNSGDKAAFFEMFYEVE